MLENSEAHNSNYHTLTYCLGKQGSMWWQKWNNRAKEEPVERSGKLGIYMSFSSDDGETEQLIWRVFAMHRHLKYSYLPFLSLRPSKN